MNIESNPPLELFERYLDLLNIPKRKPTIDNLFELVKAKLVRVPFENISKLFYTKIENLNDLPGLKRYLDGIEKYNFGGTCYTNNYYFHLLLKHLGYNVSLCGASMKNPDVHLVNVVYINSREFLVDAGYAAPFLEPLPIDLKHDYRIDNGQDYYVLKPKDKNANSNLEFYRENKLVHGYIVSAISRTIGHFQKTIEQSYTSDSTFMNALLLVRFDPNYSIRLHNLSITENNKLSSKTQLISNQNQLPAIIEKHFNIPKTITQKVIKLLGPLKDAFD